MATSAPRLQPSVSSSSQTASSDKKTSAECKKYFEVLLERKKAADNGKGKGKPADWWQYLTVILQTDPNDPNEAWNVALKCKFCEAFLSSSNPSRIAGTHLMKGGCPKIKGDADIATEVSEAFRKHPVESVQPQDEVNALQLLMNKKRKLGQGSVHGQPSAAHAFMSKDQQAKAREALADFFLEGSDAVALNMCEHPALVRFCKLVGVKPLCRKVSI